MATWNLIEDGATFAAIQSQSATNDGVMDLGPIEFNGALYQASLRVDDSGSQPFPKTCGVWKSTNDGATWTALDTANAPACLTNAICYDPVNHVLYFAYAAPPSFTNFPIRIVAFNLNTETYGAPITGGPTGIAFFYVNARYLAIRRLSNGDLWVFYPNGGTPGVGRNNIYGSKYNGSWASPLLVAAAANHGSFNDLGWGILGTQVDHNGRIYIAMRNRDNVGPNGLFYNTLSGGALSGSIQVANTTRAYRQTMGVEDTVNGRMLFGIDPGFTISGLTLKTALLKIDTTGLTWTAEDLADPEPDFDFAYTWLAIGNSLLYMMIEELSESTSESKIVYYTQPIGGGAWTGPITYSDSNTDTLPDPDTGIPWEPGNATLVIGGDGSLLVTASIGLILACGVLFFSIASPPAPPFNPCRAVSLLNPPTPAYGAKVCVGNTVVPKSLL